MHTNNNRDVPARAGLDHRSSPMVISLAWDIALNATIPLACYFLAKRFVSSSELTALVFATVFPLLKSGYDLVRRRELDPVAALVLLGIATSILAIFVGGDPRVLHHQGIIFHGCVRGRLFSLVDVSTSDHVLLRPLLHGRKGSSETGDV
jgi:hypothetical protein